MKEKIENNIPIQDLLNFIECYATYIYKIDRGASHHPINVYEKILAEHGEKKSASGVKAALNDMVSDSFSLSYEDVRKVDEFFVAKNILSLTFMRKFFSKKYERILRNKKIKSIEEYYLIKDILDDGHINLDDDEKSQLELLKINFELNRG